MLTMRLPFTLSFLIGITTCAHCIAAPAEQETGKQQNAKRQIAKQEMRKQASAQPASAGDTRALNLVTRVSKFYAGLTSLSYSVNTSVTSKHANTDQKQNADYDVRLSKPLNLAIDTTREKNENKTLARLNANEFAIYLPAKGYLKMKAADVPVDTRIPTDLAAITSRELALFGFLGVVCSQDPMQSLAKCKPLNTNKFKFVGSEKIAGATTQHIELVSDADVGLQWDIWVRDGEKPWVSRTLTRLDNRKSAVKIEITTNFSKWQDNPKFAANAFNFVPPAGAKLLKNPGDQDQTPAAAQLKGKTAPPIKLKTIDGGTFNLADSKGKEVVVVDFWATWCPPCREALPILAEVTHNYASKGVRFCAIDLREDAGKIKEYLTAQGLKINCALDADGSVARSYGAKGIPQSVIIGKDGKIKVVHIGFSEDLKDSLPKELDAVLAGHDPQ